MGQHGYEVIILFITLNFHGAGFQLEFTFIMFMAGNFLKLGPLSQSIQDKGPNNQNL